MPRQKKDTSKVNVSNDKKKQIKEVKSEKELFPHSEFPCRLEYKDGKENKICYFQCEIHMKKHIERYKINKKDCKISIKQEKEL